MIDIIAKLNDIASSLENADRDDLAAKIDKATEFLFEAYKVKIKRQRRTRGLAKTKKRIQYKRNRQKIKRKNKIYKKRFKMHLKRRQKLKHYERIG